MTRTERKQMIKNRKVYRVISIMAMILFIINTIIIMGFVRIDKPTPFNIITIMLLWITPIIIGITLTGLSQSLSFDIAKETYSILYRQQQIRVSLFWDLIKEREYIKAKELYNMKNYITNNSFRSLCNGVLIGTLQLYGEIDGIKITPDERMQEMIYGK